MNNLSAILPNPYPETRHEIEFIKNLGKHLEFPTKKPRADLLRGYLKGCALRADWCKIDREKVIAFAESELLKEIY